MRSAGCSAKIERTLSKMVGVQRVRVELGAECAELELLDRSLAIDDIITAVQARPCACAAAVTVAGSWIPGRA